MNPLNTSKCGVTTGTSMGSMFQCLTNTSVKKFFLIPNLNIYWCILRPLPIALLLAAWDKKLILTPASFQGAAEGNKFSPETPFLQAKQAQLPQPHL